MFDRSLPEPTELAAASDAALAAAVSGWAAASAAAEARKLAAIAEVQRRAATAGVRDLDGVDDVDAAAAVVSCALTVSHGKAVHLVDVALTLRDRLPMTAARFLAGQISGAMIATIYDRTLLVTPTALPHIDYEVAQRASAWGVLTKTKLEHAIDVWIDHYDPDAVRRTRDAMRGRYMKVGSRTDAATGTVSVHGRLSAGDAAIVAQRLAAMIGSVCQDDPRTKDQRRADATGAVYAGSFFLACKCDNPDCAAKVDDGRASSIVIHIVGEKESLDAAEDPLMDGPEPQPEPEPAPAASKPEPPARRKAALIPSLHGAIVPAPLLAELIAHGAKVRLVALKDCTAEHRYRPSAALQEFVRTRDLTCRFPGCDLPAVNADIDHTVPYPAGATHPANTKCYCRKHHSIKTFLAGWRDRQHPDGTVVVTTPAGLSYATTPFSRLLFPGWNTRTPPPPPSQAPSAPAHPGRHLMMPTRQRTRAQNRAARITAERRHNALERARKREKASAATPTAWHDDYWSFLDEPRPDYGDDPPPF
ncbi:protein of uncharacterised function DUF222 [Mycolicibacterium aurum]|uniref:Protein of uncharacterized function DUF222 n=1 Tax=Mycolicibacterium aurum TaxID=1791 RepID=A0A448J1N3_MYCAU|nr:HNH endonuclease signature motif containing protein [Mycolicibacterium aurum]VEG58514.1 protein of uncharacterised function DUF222 [Mycolicibacterium aurum]